MNQTHWQYKDGIETDWQVREGEREKKQFI